MAAFRAQGLLLPISTSFSHRRNHSPSLLNMVVLSFLLVSLSTFLVLTGSTLELKLSHP
jgi:hypothetical protein